MKEEGAEQELSEPVTSELPGALKCRLPVTPEVAQSSSVSADCDGEFMNSAPRTPEVSARASVALSNAEERDSLKGISNSGPNPAIPPLKSDHLAAGLIWDERFSIIEQLGEGGMASVYKASHIQMSCTVALKIMHRHIADNGGAARFLREARLLSSLNHPNVVILKTFGETTQGVLFMAMEFIEGTTLAQLLSDKNAIDPQRSVLIIRQVCSGLQAAHEIGITHRDLKPSNIMISHDDGHRPVIKVIDFGLAQGDKLDTRLTRTNAILGSPLYMSPEQCAGKQADSRSDIYAVGCCLYEMLCGQPPFIGDNALSVFAAHMHVEVTHIPVVSSIPRSLHDVLLKCLSKEPAKRYSCIKDLDEALSKIDWDTQRIIYATAKKKLSFYKLVFLCTVIVPFALICFKKPAPSPGVDFLHSTNRVMVSSTLADEIATDPPAKQISYLKAWLDKDRKTELQMTACAHFRLAVILQAVEAPPKEVAKEFSQALELFAKQNSKLKKMVPVDYAQLFINASSSTLCLINTASQDVAVNYLTAFLSRNGSRLPVKSQGAAYLRLAELQVAVHQYDEAVQSCQRSTLASKKAEETTLGFRAQLLLARSLWKLGRKKEAREAFREVGKLLEHCDSAAKMDCTETAAQQYLEIGEYDSAQICYERVETLAKSFSKTPNFATVTGRYNCLKLMGRFSDAATVYYSAIDFKDFSAADRWTAIAGIASCAQYATLAINLETAVDKTISSIHSKDVDANLTSKMVQAARRLCQVGQAPLAVKALRSCRNLDLSKPDMARQAPGIVQTFIDCGEYQDAKIFAQRVIEAGVDSRIKIRAMALRAVAQSYMGEFQIAENQLERARLLSVGLEESIESIQNLLDCAVVAANQGHTKAVESALFTASAMLKHWPALLTPLMEQLPERIYGAAANRNRQLALRLYQWGTDIPDSNPTHKIVFTRETGDRFYGLKDYKTAAELWLRITDSLACSSEPLPSWFEFATITRLACMKCGKTAEAARLQALCTKLRDHQAPMTRIRHAPWSS